MKYVVSDQKQALYLDVVFENDTILAYGILHCYKIIKNNNLNYRYTR